MTIPPRPSRTALAITVAFLAACSGDEGPAAPGAPASITFSEPSLMVALRGTAQLAPIVRDDEGRSIVNASGVTWESTNPDIASVDAAGVIHGQALGGPVTITAKAGSVEGSVPVTVVPASASIAPSVSSLAVGSSLQLNVVATDATGAAIPNGSIVWSSTHPAVAAVDPQTGELEALSIGNTIIKAQADGFNATGGLYVGVPRMYDGLFLSTDTPNLDVSLTIYLGRVIQFSADWRPSPECRMEFGATPFAEVPALSQSFQFRLSNWSVNAIVTVVNDSVIVGSVPSIPATALSQGCLVHYGLSNTQNLASRNVLGTSFIIYRP